MSRRARWRLLRRALERSYVIAEAEDVEEGAARDGEEEAEGEDEGDAEPVAMEEAELEA